MKSLQGALGMFQQYPAIYEPKWIEVVLAYKGSRNWVPKRQWVAIDAQIINEMQNLHSPLPYPSETG